MKTHISLNVKDIGRSIRFYQKMFGVEPFKVKPDYAKFDIADPPLNLTMNQAAVVPGGALSHLGLQVASTAQVESVAGRWDAAGLPTLEEKGTDCCYALQDKVWVSDPDGNRWEVFTVLEDTGGISGQAASCCAPAETAAGISGAGGKDCC